MVKMQGNSKNGSNKTNFRKKGGDKMEDRFCVHCKVHGNLRENCFKIIGYPEWYVEMMKAKKEKKTGKQQANMIDVTAEQEKSMNANQQDWMTDLIKQEVAKLLKTNQFAKEGSVNFITSYFACMEKGSCSKRGLKRSWIIDFGASNHICVKQ